MGMMGNMFSPMMILHPAAIVPLK